MSISQVTWPTFGQLDISNENRDPRRRRPPEISVATKAFLRRRTAGIAPEHYAKLELVVPDGFADRYMGKDYAGTHHTELFSCGMEAITQGPASSSTCAAATGTHLQPEPRPPLVDGDRVPGGLSGESLECQGADRPLRTGPHCRTVHPTTAVNLKHWLCPLPMPRPLDASLRQPCEVPR